MKFKCINNVGYENVLTIGKIYNGEITHQWHYPKSKRIHIFICDDGVDGFLRETYLNRRNEMKKGTGKFKQVEETVHVCDECRIPIDVLNSVEYDCTWTDGFDSFGERMEFCSLDCLKQHLLKHVGDDSSYYFPYGELVTLQVPSHIMKSLLF